MSQHLAVIAIVMGNLCGALIAWMRLRASVKSRSIHDAARCDVVRMLGPGSRIVDVDGDTRVMIEIGPRNPQASS